jgi:gamma-glutamylcyclotransferase (GGCT)/AIG2-like uncharacterized protein YtfP
VSPGSGFVYGTLRPGQSRWHHLAPYVIGEGVLDRVAGWLYDTGLGYPAARFSAGAEARVVGQTFEFAVATTSSALELLDEIEGAVRGLYRRVVVLTDRGVSVWAYEVGEDHAGPAGLAGLDLRPIPTGDWLERA